MVMLSPTALPERVRDVDHLEDVMTTPTQVLVDDLGRAEPYTVAVKIKVRQE